MKFFIAFFLLLFSTNVFAKEYKLLELEHFDFRYAKFKSNRDPYVPERDDWGYRAGTSFKLGLFGGLLYWDNLLHTETVNTGTVKTVGWHWVAGARLSKYIDLFAEHHSRHIMEEYRATKHGKNTFPVEDSYGVRFIFVDGGGSQSTFMGFLD